MKNYCDITYYTAEELLIYSTFTSACSLNYFDNFSYENNVIVYFYSLIRQSNNKSVYTYRS